MPDSCYLAPQERNVQAVVEPSACGPDADPESIGVAFRHTGWQSIRDKIRAALVRSAAADSRIAAWDDCGRNAVVLRDPETPGAYRVACTTCKDRFCVPCADSRSHRIGRRLRAHVDDNAISFLTLTLRDNDVSLSQLLNKLIISFRQLRQWPIWKREVAGGVAFIEIKFNADKQRWHPHLHAIMDAGYIPQSAIRDQWLKITKTSFHVDIRRADDPEHAVRYVTKYGSKPLNQSFVSDDARLDEALDALKGRHLAIVFGDWRGWCLSDDDEYEKWPMVASLSSLIARGRRGDPDALKILEYLKCTTLIKTTSATNPRASPESPTNAAQTCLKDEYGVSDAVAKLMSTLGQPSHKPCSVSPASITVHSAA